MTMGEVIGRFAAVVPVAYAEASKPGPPLQVSVNIAGALIVPSGARSSLTSAARAADNPQE